MLWPRAHYVSCNLQCRFCVCAFCVREHFTCLSVYESCKRLRGCYTQAARERALNFDKTQNAQAAVSGLWCGEPHARNCGPTQKQSRARACQDGLYTLAPHAPGWRWGGGWLQQKFLQHHPHSCTNLFLVWILCKTQKHICS